MFAMRAVRSELRVDTIVTPDRYHHKQLAIIDLNGKRDTRAVQRKPLELRSTD